MQVVIPTLGSRGDVQPFIALAQGLVNMGASVNGASEDASPYLTADGLYLFFTARRSGDEGYTPYWVSTQLIDSLRVRAGVFGGR